MAYFTAIFPYIVLLILIIQSATLAGAVEGVKYYVIPKWDRVAQFEVSSSSDLIWNRLFRMKDLASRSFPSIFLTWS